MRGHGSGDVLLQHERVPLARQTLHVGTGADAVFNGQALAVVAGAEALRVARLEEVPRQLLVAQGIEIAGTRHRHRPRDRYAGTLRGAGERSLVDQRAQHVGGGGRGAEGVADIAGE